MKKQLFFSLGMITTCLSGSQWSKVLQGSLENIICEIQQNNLKKKFEKNLKHHKFNAAEKVLREISNQEIKTFLKKNLDETYEKSIPGQLKKCLEILEKDTNTETDYHNIFDILTTLFKRIPVNQSEADIQRFCIPEAQEALIDLYGQKIFEGIHPKLKVLYVDSTKKCIKNIFSHKFTEAKTQIDLFPQKLKEKLQVAFHVAYSPLSIESRFSKIKVAIELLIVDYKNLRNENVTISTLEEQAQELEKLLKNKPITAQDFLCKKRIPEILKKIKQMLEAK